MTSVLWDRVSPAAAARCMVLVLLVVLAGCTGSLFEASATPATISEDALDRAGYVHGNTTAVPLTYPVGVAGLSRNVTVESWLSGYTAASDDGVAGLVLLSSPNVEIADRSLNPLAQLSNRDRVGMVLERSSELRVRAGLEDVTDLRELEDRQVTVLGSSTELVSYAGTADVEGERVDIVLNVAVVEHGDDLIVALGFHEAAREEQDRQATLVEAIVHEG